MTQIERNKAISRGMLPIWLGLFLTGCGGGGGGTDTPATADTTPPGPPTYSATQKALFNLSAPILTGTAEAGSSITIYDAGEAVATATTAGDGTWTVTLANISDGEHTYTVQATDDAGNVSGASVELTVSVDTLPPAVSAITSPLIGLSNNAGPITLSGTAEVASTITLTDGNTVIGTLTVLADGLWSFDIASLSEGEHRFSVESVDAAGNSSRSDVILVTIDTVPPAIPTLTSPSPGLTNHPGPMTISGTAEALSQITLYDGTNVTGTTTTTSAGSWSVLLTNPVDGTYAFTTQAMDSASNVSGVSPLVAISIDTTAPGAPSITSSASGLTNSAGPFTISVNAEPQGNITLYNQGVMIDTAIASNNGSGSFTLPNLTDGGYVYTARVVDLAGNASALSQEILLTVDTTAPANPIITTPTAGFSNQAGPITLSGTAEANTTLTLYNATTIIGTTTVTSSGDWSITRPEPSDGDYNYRTRAVDAAGNTSEFSVTVALSIDTVAPLIPEITSPSPGIYKAQALNISGTAEALATVTLYESGVAIDSQAAGSDGLWSFSITASDGEQRYTAKVVDRASNSSDNSVALTLTIDSKAPNAPILSNPMAGMINSLRPSISGTTEADSIIEVFANAISLGTVTASATGSWALALASDLAQGQQSLTATASDEAGNVSITSAATAITVDTIAPTVPVINSPTAGALNTPGGLTVEGTAEALMNITLYEAGAEIDSQTVGSDGTWSFAIPSPSDGEYSYSVEVIDLANNASGHSPLLILTVDNTAPSAPVLDAPTANPLNNAQPTITGTAEANSVLELFSGASSLGSVTTSGGSTWSLSPSTELAQGPHTLSAIATDSVGNVSPLSATINVTIDSIAPEVPVITSPSVDITQNSNTMTLTGTAEALTTITLYDDGNAISSKLTSSGGSWSFSLSSLAEGAHPYTVEAVDNANNPSGDSATLNITVDTIAPIAPEITSPTSGWVKDTRLRMTGTAEANSVIEFFVDAVAKGTTTASGDGAWEWVLIEDLAQGLHLLTTTATDSVNNTSPASAITTVTVDSEPPSTLAAPTSIITVNNVTYTWLAATDANSGVDHYSLRIYEVNDGSASMRFDGNVGNVLGYTYATQPGKSYIAEVQALDAVGNATPWSELSSGGTFVSTPTYDAILTLSGENIRVKSVKTDNLGNRLLAGSFTGIMAFNSTGSDLRDAGLTDNGFIISTAPNGTKLWDWYVQSGTNFTAARNPGQTDEKDYIQVEGITVDSEGSVYAIGHFSGSVDFDPGVNTDIHATMTPDDASLLNNVFVTKLSSTGAYLWTKSYLGNGWDYGHDIIADSNNDIYIAGNFKSTPLTFGSSYPTDRIDSTSPQNQGADSFVSKLSKNGTEIWTRTYGGMINTSLRGYSAVHSLVLSEDESTLTMSGSFAAFINFTPSDTSASIPFTTASESTYNLFVAQVNASTGAYQWSYQIDAWSDDHKETTWAGPDTINSRLASNSLGDIFLTSFFKRTANFNGVDVVTSTLVNGRTWTNDAFIMKLSNTGVHQWTKIMAGDGDNRSEGISIDATDSLYITGRYNDTIDFDPSAGQDIYTATGSSDAFILRLDDNDIYNWTRTFDSSANANTFGRAITTTGERIISVGNLSGSTDFDPNSGVVTGGISNANGAYLSELLVVLPAP